MNVPAAPLSRLKLWIWRGSLVSIAPIVDVVLRFGRTAILARLLVPGELGTAVAFGVVVATAGLVTDMAFDKFLMTKPGDSRALDAVHVLSLIRGTLLACLLFIGAPRIADSFGVPQFAGSFAVLSVVPLIFSLAHFGIKQLEGTFNYTLEMWAQLLAAVVAFITLFPAIYLWGDHRAMVACLIAQTTVYCIASHALAPTPYRLSANRDMLRLVLTYGIPLTLNGVGLAIVSQFDRALVGHWFDVSTLALYAILLSLTGVPISLLDRIAGKITLSFLVTAATDRRANRDVDTYTAVVFVYAVLSSAYALFVAMTFDSLVPLIFGSNFSVTFDLLLLMTARVFFLIQMNGAPSRRLLATGRTRALTFLSLSSGFGLLLAFVLVHWWPSIETVLLSLLVGDMLRAPFFFLIASPAKAFRRIWADIVISGATVASVVSVLGFWSELSWTVRGAAFSAGMFGISIQMAYGLRRHPILRNLFVRGT